VPCISDRLRRDGEPHASAPAPTVADESTCIETFKNALQLCFVLMPAAAVVDLEFDDITDGLFTSQADKSGVGELDRIAIRLTGICRARNLVGGKNQRPASCHVKRPALFFLDKVLSCSTAGSTISCPPRNAVRLDDPRLPYFDFVPHQNFVDEMQQMVPGLDKPFYKSDSWSYIPSGSRFGFRRADIAGFHNPFQQPFGCRIAMARIARQLGHPHDETVSGVRSLVAKKARPIKFCLCLASRPLPVLCMA